MKRIYLKFALPVAIIAIGILIFLILKAASPDAEPVTVKERVWQVKTIAAKSQHLSPTLTLYGQVETPALVNAAAPSKSRVLSVSVREGDPIHKGQLLLSLDPRDYQPRLSQADAKVTELNALIASEKLHHKADQKAFKHEQKLLNLELAAVKRAEMMKNKNLGSTASFELAQEELERQQLALTTRKMNLQDHQARLQQLQARLAFAQAEQDMAQLDLERSRIIAPFEGFVEKVQVAPGDQVMDNQVLLSFYPLQELEIRAKIPNAFRYELQQAVMQDIPLVANAVMAGMPVTLQLARISGSADARGIDALFTISSGNPLLRLGSTVSLILQRPVRNNVINIPFSAIYDNNRIYSLVNGRLQSIPIQRLGEHINEDGQVTQLIRSPHIKEGDRIVITQLPNAITGLRVSEANFNPLVKNAVAP